LVRHKAGSRSSLARPRAWAPGPGLSPGRWLAGSSAKRAEPSSAARPSTASSTPS
jgi:hypothetical protein